MDSIDEVQSDDSEGISYYDLLARDSWEVKTFVYVRDEDEARQLVGDGNLGRWLVRAGRSGYYSSLAESWNDLHIAFPEDAPSTCLDIIKMRHYQDMVDSQNFTVDEGMPVLISTEEEAEHFIVYYGNYTLNLRVRGDGRNCRLIRRLLAYWGCDDAKSRYLRFKDMINLYEGISFANRKYGLIMNSHITLKLGDLGITDHKAVATIVSQFNHRIGKWLAARDCQHAYVFVHEGRSRKGEEMHTHILTYIPPMDFPAFDQMAIKWVSALTKQQATQEHAYVTHGRPRKRDQRLYLQWKWFRYICKGCEPIYVMTHKPCSVDAYLISAFNLRGLNMGLVNCRKRSGVSENIQEKARRAEQFHSRYAHGQFDRLYKEWGEDDRREALANSLGAF